jgi:acetyl esterase/lipase
VRDSKQNSKMSQENRSERTPVRRRTRTATPTIGSGDTKRDLTVSSFMLALVLVGVVDARKLDAAEVEVTLVRYDSMIHDYRFFKSLRVARETGGSVYAMTKGRLPA